MATQPVPQREHGEAVRVREMILGLGAARADRRLEAVNALAGCGHPDAVPVLCTALSDREFEVRLAASQALEQLADERAVPALRAALERCHHGDESLGDALEPVLWRLLICVVIGLLLYRLFTSWTIVGMLLGPSQLVVHACATWMRTRRSRSPLALSLTRALERVLDQQPGPGVRATLEPLRQIGRDRAGQNPATRQASARLVRRIEKETEHLKDLPLPTAPTAPGPAGLPAPSSAGGCRQGNLGA